MIDYAYFQAGGLQSKEKNAKRTYTISDIKDNLGNGKCLNIHVAFTNYAGIIWQAILYEGKDFIVFRMGIDNTTEKEYRLMSFYPLISGNAYKGIDNHQGYRILDL